MTTDPTTALEKFITETDRQRWWTTPELTVALVSSGLWAEAGLGDPEQQQIVAKNGPRFYIVEVDGHDRTAAVDAVLGAFAPDFESDKLDMKSLVRLALGGERIAPFYVYKRFGHLIRQEMELLSAWAEMHAVFNQQCVDEAQVVMDLMDAMGAEVGGEVLPDTGRVQFMMEVRPRLEP